MWKKPSRPDHAVSQTFNAGVVTIYRVTDAAQPGYKPQPRTAELVMLPYDARTVGVSRYYAARQAQVQLDRVLRVPDPDIAAGSGADRGRAGLPHRAGAAGP